MTDAVVWRGPDDLRGMLVPLAELTLDPANARLHPPANIDGIRASYALYGQQKPIVASAAGVVSAGNGTVEALRAGPIMNPDSGQHEQWTHVAAVTSDLDRQQLIGFGIVDNRTGELAVWDEEVLGRRLRGLSEDGWDASAFGWDDAAIDDMVAAASDDAAIASGSIGDGDEADALEDITDPVTELGDVWMLGEHRLVCGDATDAAVVASALDGKLANCVWTDPPYGVAVVGGSRMKPVDQRLAEGGKTIQNDDMDARSLLALLGGAFKAVTTNAIDGAAVYIAHPAGALSVTFGQAFLAAGWRLHETLVWVKNSLVLGHSDYHYIHEPILYGYTPGGGRRGRGGDGWYGDHAQTTVLSYDRPPRSAEHPTMKPVALIAHCIRNSSPRRGVVLDPFAGSGSTLIAAHDLGRRAALVELDPRYVDVICRRWQRHTGDLPVRSSTGEPTNFEVDGE